MSPRLTLALLEKVKVPCKRVTIKGRERGPDPHGL
jgi:hypothetical protein